MRLVRWTLGDGPGTRPAMGSECGSSKLAHERPKKPFERFSRMQVPWFKNLECEAHLSVVMRPSFLSTDPDPQVLSLADFCGQPVALVWLICSWERGGSSCGISLKSGAVQMQGAQPLPSADGPPYVLRLDPYHLPQHPIWLCISLNSASADLISFIINP